MTRCSSGLQLLVYATSIAIVVSIGIACAGKELPSQGETAPTSTAPQGETASPSTSPSQALACPPPTGNALHVKRPHASLKGTVKDSDTGAPVPGARIIFQEYDARLVVTPQLAGPCTISDASGAYEFGTDSYFDPNIGQFRFQIEAPGYGMIQFDRDLSYMDNPDVEPGSPENCEVQDFSIVPGENVYRNDIDGFFITFPPLWGFPSLKWTDGAGSWATSPDRRTPRYAICEVRWDKAEEGETAEDHWGRWSDGDHPFTIEERSTAQLGGISTTRLIFTGAPLGQLQQKGLAYVFSRGDQLWFAECFVNLHSEYFAEQLPTYEDILQSITFD